MTPLTFDVLEEFFYAMFSNLIVPFERNSIFDEAFFEVKSYYLLTVLLLKRILTLDEGRLQLRKDRIMVQILLQKGTSLCPRCGC